jgi:hypothetical protein
MSHVLHDLLRAVEVLSPRASGGLQVFGLRHRPQPHFDYDTLDEALAAKSLEVTEVGEAGSVPTLRLTNRAGRRVFLMSGEQLIGAKQNRVLNTSLMVEGMADVPIPVSCVEQGRWAYRSRQFESHGTGSHGKLRHMMSKSVTESYARSRTPTSNQGEVWREVSRKLGAMASACGSHALEQTYLDHGDRLGEFLAALPVPEGCSGAVFALNGRVVGADLFDRPETFAKLWPKLVRSYALDALEESADAPPALDRTTAEGWLRRAADLEPKPFASPGLGEDVRLSGTEVVGAGLVVEQQPVHVQLFNESKA